MKDETDFIPIPESYTRRKLNTLYREIPLKDTTSRTLRKYFNAMANLYGVITLRDAYGIISSQSPKLVTEAEFLAFAEIARHECENYFILGDDEIYEKGNLKSPFEREIIDTMLFHEDAEQYFQTKKSQQGKPRYVPDKQQLLCYNDGLYCEETPAFAALKDFLHTRLDLTEIEKRHVLAEVLLGSRYIQGDFTTVMENLNEMGIVFKRTADFQKFAELHQQFHNTMRMQCNCGHTPEELSQMLPPEKRIPRDISLGPNLRQLIADAEKDSKKNEKAKKVERNDPCPCGSGKKYKNCCGRVH